MSSTESITPTRETPANRQVRLFGVKIDALRMSEAVARVMAWVEARDGSCRYVVTPNVDHTVMLQENAQLRRAYDDAALILADGAPVVLASWLLGKPVPERLAGSDFTPAVFAAATPERPLRVFLLGAMPGVAEQAAARIEATWPGVRVVGWHSPPLGFENDAAENARILEQIAAARVDVLVVGLGAPKQEIWVHRHRHALKASVALCVGATIDFLAGVKNRAPRWMQRSGLEWLYRLAKEPTRLYKRYARDAWLFPQLVWREWRGAKLHKAASSLRGGGVQPARR